MAENRLPSSLPALFTLGRDMHDGVTAIGAAVCVKQNTPAVLGDVLDAARAASTAYEDSRAVKAARTAASTIADSNAKGFIVTGRDALKPTLGTAWSLAWEGVGFAHGSLGLPETTGERQELVRTFGEYLAAHATLENAPLGVTAARAQVLFTALDNARAAVRAALADTTQKRAARDIAVEALRAQMRGLIAELTQLLSPDDGRWATFGLNPPAAPNRPDVPDGVVAHPGPAGSGSLYIDWDDAPRAERYRVYKQVAGIDSEFVAAVTVHDSAATLTDLPAGAEVKVRVTAANDTGETKPSAPVTVTMN
jgi:hypothetical protein